MGITLEAVKELNYDHHRRMTIEHDKLIEAGVAADYSSHNEDSLRNLTSRVIGGRVLELGASDGNDFAAISAALNIVAIKGIDIHEPSVLRGQEMGRDLVVGYVEDLPFENEAFDLVISRHVMEHVSDVDVALRGIYRVMAPHGLVAAVTPAYQPDPEPAHIQQLSLAEWSEAYERNGFVVIYGESRHHACDESHIVAVKR